MCVRVLKEKPLKQLFIILCAQFIVFLVVFPQVDRSGTFGLISLSSHPRQKQTAQKTGCCPKIPHAHSSVSVQAEVCVCVGRGLISDRESNVRLQQR